MKRALYLDRWRWHSAAGISSARCTLRCGEAAVANWELGVASRILRREFRRFRIRWHLRIW